MKKRLLSLALCSSLLVAGASTHAAAPAGGISFSDPLDRITLQNGTEKRFDVGIGSGACRLQSDLEGVIYTVTDRGPNIKTKDSKKLMGVDFGKEKGKIFPTPNFAPTIYKLEVKDGHVTVLEKIQIKAADGTQISGISNPDTEAAWDINGKELAKEILPEILRKRPLNRGIESMAASPLREVPLFCHAEPAGQSRQEYL
jgi:hypothetical protein